MAQQDWKLAYSFASPGFRSGVDIDQFIFIINAQYGMLLDNQGYAFNACTIADEKITQEVAINTDSEVFNLYYILSVTGGVLGVDSSSSNLSETKLEA